MFYNQIWVFCRLRSKKYLYGSYLKSFLRYGVLQVERNNFTFKRTETCEDRFELKKGSGSGRDNLARGHTWSAVILCIRIGIKCEFLTYKRLADCDTHALNCFACLKKVIKGVFSPLSANSFCCLITPLHVWSSFIVFYILTTSKCPFFKLSDLLVVFVATCLRKLLEKNIVLHETSPSFAAFPSITNLKSDFYKRIRIWPALGMQLQNIWFLFISKSEENPTFDFLATLKRTYHENWTFRRAQYCVDNITIVRWCLHCFSLVFCFMLEVVEEISRKAFSSWSLS